MRISSINVALPKNYNYQTKVKEAQAPKVNVEQPSFKGLKGGLFSAIGMVVGGAVGTVLTGGIVAPFLLAAAGAVAGGEYGNKDESHCDENGIPYDNELTGFDYIG